jgi:hypothetical protein
MEGEGQARPHCQPTADFVHAPAGRIRSDSPCRSSGLSVDYDGWAGAKQAVTHAHAGDNGDFGVDDDGMD